MFRAEIRPKKEVVYEKEQSEDDAQPYVMGPEVNRKVFDLTMGTKALPVKDSEDKTLSWLKLLGDVLLK